MRWLGAFTVALVGNIYLLPTLVYIRDGLWPVALWGSFAAAACFWMSYRMLQGRFPP